MEMSFRVQLFWYEVRQLFRIKNIYVHKDDFVHFTTCNRILNKKYDYV